MTRASYGTGEDLAHSMIQREAEGLGLVIRTDAIGSLYITLPGLNRSEPALMTGSHLDSVPHGGNYDGAAGALAGLVMLERLLDYAPPPCDVTLMVIRAEEMIWFPEHYLGSRAAFGLLPPDTPDHVRRSDTGLTLSEHIIAAGFDPDAIRSSKPQITASAIRAFVEVHIEQGPMLVQANRPVGIVSSIRGNIRHRFGKIIGETTHAGGVPRNLRRDVVLAGADLLGQLEGFWQEAEARGEDLVITVGEFATDAASHGITKVPGLLRFSLDARSQSETVLDTLEAFLQEQAVRIGQQRRVKIELGPRTRAAVAPMAPDVIAGLQGAAEACGVSCLDLPSGGGHDCAVFAGQGVRCGMIFVRNENGSHNPDERMEFKDFAAACDVLTKWVQSELQISR
ncbi:MAG: hydantoinase/carbamoylase family amidase [Pseudomonadota bacterium]